MHAFKGHTGENKFANNDELIKAYNEANAVRIESVVEDTSTEA